MISQHGLADGLSDEGAAFLCGVAVLIERIGEADCGSIDARVGARLARLDIDDV